MTPPPSLRSIVLSVVDQANGPLTGRQIAAATGLTYRQTIDSLNALHDHGRIQRIGRKYTARWVSLSHSHPHKPVHELELAFRSIFQLSRTTP